MRKSKLEDHRKVTSTSDLISNIEDNPDNKNKFRNPSYSLKGRKIFSEENYEEDKERDGYCQDNESDDSKLNSDKSKIKINSRKNYKFNKNTDDDIIHMLSDNKLRTNTNLKVHDLRFFDLNNSSNNTIVFIHHSDPNYNLINLFIDMQCIFVLSEKTLQNQRFKKNKYESNRSIRSESLFILEDENIKKNMKTETSLSGLSINELIVLYLEEGYKKCFNLLNQLNKEKNTLKNKRILIYFETGLSDIEIFLFINFLSKINKQDYMKKTDLILITDESISFILEDNMNILLLPKSILSSKGVGLLPLHKSVISTKGFRWDITHWETSFGHTNLSTSNVLMGDEVKIFVESGSIIFTAEINKNYLYK